MSIEHDMEKKGREEGPEDFLAFFPVGFLRCSCQNGGAVDFVSQGILDLFACESREAFFALTGGTFAGMIFPEDYDETVKTLEAQLKSGLSDCTAEFRIQRKDKEIRWAEGRCRLVMGTEGQNFFYCALVDNTDSKLLSQHYREQARTDGLTGLLNKEASKRAVNQYLWEEAGQGEDRGNGAMMIIDIDNFKTINDTRGHLFGDMVLSQIGTALKKLFRRSDIVGRIGGDEFMVFLRDMNDSAQAAQHGQRIIQCVSGLMKEEESGLKVTCSVGVSLYPRDGQNFDQLMSRADIALYYGKLMGKNLSVCYEERMSTMEKLHSLVQNRVPTKIETDEKGPESYEVVQHIFRTLYQSETREQAVSAVLELIGRHYNVSRAYIFESSLDGLRVSNTYEWCAPGISSQKQEGQDVCWNTELPDYKSNFDEKGIFFCPDAGNLQATPQLKRLLEKRKVKSLLQCTICSQGEMIGLAGFDECGEKRFWSQEQSQVLFYVCRLLALFLQQKREGKRMNLRIQELEGILNRAPDWVYVMDPESWELCYVNQTVEKEAYGPAIGKPCYEEIGAQEGPCPGCPVLSQENGGQESGKFYDGSLKRWFQVQTVPIRWKDREALAVFRQGLGRDEKSIGEGADTDSLTGLMTYDSFCREGQKKLDREGQSLVLVASDIKGFKYINSMLGYDQGDQILKAFGGMIFHAGPEELLRARVNGDLFLSLETCRDRQAFLERLEQINDQFCRQENQHYRGVNLRIRSGVYFVEPECREINLAVDRANLARKSVDYILKSTTVVYQEEPFSREYRENAMINRMEYALTHQEFQVYLQPKVRLQDGSLAGAEALIRWVCQDGTVIWPGEFIALFEKNGFITRLDLYVLEQVCMWLKRRAGQGEKAVQISINLSSVDISSDQIIAQILERVDRYGIDHGLLEFELTETAFLSNTQRTCDVMKALRDQGFSTAIDDFGSGYSIMNIMAEIPTDMIKMDCGFLQSCEKTGRGREFLGQLIRMINQMGFTSLCEGIETKQQLDMLKSMGCQLGQGYYSARPMSMEDFDRYLADERSKDR